MPPNPKTPRRPAGRTRSAGPAPAAAGRSTPKPARSDNATSRSTSEKPRPGKPGPTRTWLPYEAEALGGLEAVAAAELQTVPQTRATGSLRFLYAGEPARLSRLRGSTAVYRVQRFEVPRPKALLGHQYLGQLTAFLAGVAAMGGHRSFRFGAAGRDSAVFARLAEALAQGLGLPFDPEEGELLVRFVRAREEGSSHPDPDDWDSPEPPGANPAAWDVLARITPRPLSARPWRVCNLAGGLNATLAYALHKAAGPRESDRIFNPMCGSGTLLIERELMGPSAALVGVDLSEAAVACARQNITAAGRRIEVAQVDALHTGLPPRSFDLIVSDLPWGDAVGSHGGNAELYPAFLKEMHRLCSRQGRLVVLTHEIRLFERLLTEQQLWQARELFQVAQGGHHPRAYLLNRR